MKYLAVAFSLLTTLVLVVGCAPETPQSPGVGPSSIQRPEAVTVPAGETYEWVMFSNSAPQQGWAPQVWENQIIPDLDRVTNGRLKIDILYPGEHPYKAGDTLSALSQNVCQLLYANYQHIGATDPRFTVADLPFLLPSGHTVKKDIHRLLAPLYDQWYSEWNISELLEHYNPSQHLWLRDGWLDNVDSVSGKRIRTFSADMDNVVTMMGGDPIRIDPAEAYTALQTGLLDGLITGVVFSVTSKFPEVAKHFQPLDVFQTTLPIFVNNDAWNELPTEIQDAVSAYLWPRMGWYADGEIRVENETLLGAVADFGLEIRPVPAGVREEYVARSYEAVWLPWAERVGPGAADTLDSVVALIREAGYEVQGYPN